MDDPVERATSSLSQALKVRKLEEELRREKDENENLKKQLKNIEELQFDALLRTSILDPAGFVARLKTKKIRLPSDGASVDVDSLKVNQLEKILKQVVLLGIWNGNKWFNCTFFFIRNMILGPA